MYRNRMAGMPKSCERRMVTADHRPVKGNHSSRMPARLALSRMKKPASRLAQTNRDAGMEGEFASRAARNIVVRPPVKAASYSTRVGTWA